MQGNKKINDVITPIDENIENTVKIPPLLFLKEEFTWSNFGFNRVY